MGPLHPRVQMHTRWPENAWVLPPPSLPGGRTAVRSPLLPPQPCDFPPVHPRAPDPRLRLRSRGSSPHTGAQTARRSLSPPGAEVGLRKPRPRRSGSPQARGWWRTLSARSLRAVKTPRRPPRSHTPVPGDRHRAGRPARKADDGHGQRLPGGRDTWSTEEFSYF